MLTTQCIHPGLMRAVSLLGHGDKLLIADGNYPLSTKTGEAQKIWLGLCPGIPTATDVLKALLGVIKVEKAQVMSPGGTREPEIFQEFRQALGGMELEQLGRFEFYDACGEKTLCLAISTGEKRTFANLMLTVGVA